MDEFMTEGQHVPAKKKSKRDFDFNDLMYLPPPRQQEEKIEKVKFSSMDFANCVSAFRNVVSKVGDSKAAKVLQRIFNSVDDSQLMEALGDAMYLALPYDEYLKTIHWMKKRKECYQASGYRCALCNADDELQAHHRTYENIGKEKPGDCIALCGRCHSLFHEHATADGQA